MTEEELNEKYFEWLYQLVVSERYFGSASYKKLLMHLHNRVFNWTIPMDGNRAEDGINLRYVFGLENDIDDRAIASFLDYRPCSVLEMLAALAHRMDVQIMYDEDYGDRTFCWFWGMMTCLGLESQTDILYDPMYVDRVIDRLIDREYEPNGEGGLFCLENCEDDLRGVEIWDQMNWYLNEILESDGPVIDI